MFISKFPRRQIMFDQFQSLKSEMFFQILRQFRLYTVYSEKFWDKVIFSGMHPVGQILAKKFSI